MIEPLSLQKKGEVLLNTIIYPISIHTVLQGIYRSVFIKDSYACLEEKGTHEAVHRIQHYMRLAQWKYEEPYIVKIDVRKFFYSINRDILKYDYIQIEDKDWKFGDISPKKRKEMESRGKRNHT